MPTQNFRVKSGLEVGTGVTISAGIITASRVSVGGSITAGSFYGDGSGLTNAGSALSSASGSQRIVLTSLTSGTMTSAATTSTLSYDSSSNTLFTNQLNVTGISSFNSSIYLGDGDVAYFGDGQDLLIFHNSTDSLIRDSGTGDLFLQGGNAIRMTNPTGIETYATFNQDGAVELWFDNSKKLETTGAGITVTGTTFSNQLSVSGVSTFSGVTTYTAPLFGTQASFTGVVTATTFNGQVNAGVGTITTLSSTSASLTNINTSGVGTITTLTNTTLRNYGETVNNVGNTGTAATINLANGNFVTATLTGNCTFTFTTGLSSGAVSFTLLLTNDATAGRSIIWPPAVKWPNATVPTRTTTANKTDVYTFFTYDNGTTWWGNLSLYNYS